MEYQGIDVSKDKLDIAYYVEEKVKTTEISNTPEAILEYLKNCDMKNIQFIFESTGSYHLNLAYTLEEEGVKFTILNPMAARGFAHSFLTTTKTDAQDAIFLARFGYERKPTPTQLPSVSWQQRRQAFNEWQALLKDKQRVANRLHSLEQWKESCAVVKTQLKEQLVFLEQQIEVLREHIETAYQGSELPEEQENFDHLISIKGIGAKTATVLLFFTDHFRNFKSPKELAKFIGVVPMIHQSGKSRSKNTISKRGNAYLRALLYNCARSARRFNPACKALYTRLRERGKSYKQAMIAVVHKLIRQAFAVVKLGKPFDPEIT